MSWKSKSKSNSALLLAIGLPALTLVGCTESPEMDLLAPKKPVDTVPLKLLGAADPTDLAIFAEKGLKGVPDDDAKVQVGDSWEDAAKMFPRPNGAYDIQDLPSNFPDKFEAHGWETGKGKGFGVVVSDNKVVAAVYQTGPTTETEVNKDTLQQVSGLDPLHPKLMPYPSAKYWFWHVKTQTCMICVSELKSAFYFTMAVGDDNILKQIGVSEENAKKQMIDLEKNQALENQPK